MLAPGDMFWNTTEEEQGNIAAYLHAVSNYAAQRGFKAGEVVIRRLAVVCDLCAMPIPVRHAFLINRATDQRWCYECLEDEYRREGRLPRGLNVMSTLERPEILARFEDKGQEH